MGLTHVALAVAAGACVAACSALPAPSVGADPTPAAVDIAATDDAPVHLTFAAVGVDSDVEPTGLNPDGTIHVPDLTKATEVDFLDWSVKLAAGRPLVFISHVNGRNSAGKVIPGGFERLSHAKTGDMVTVTGRSGAQARFKVATVRTVAKDMFPSSVYNPTPTPTLVLITCGGQLRDHNYLSNVIVTADQA